MKFKLFITTLFLALSGIFSTHAQTIGGGSQVTAEDNMSSGKPYLLYYVGNNGCYVKAVTVNGNEVFKALAADRAITDEAIYYFIKDGGKWKIQSRKTGKYFPVPAKSTVFEAATDAANAGVWTMNFQTGGNIAPSALNGATTYSLNRSRTSDRGSVLHGWDQGTGQANQLQIYELALSTTSIVETGQEVSVSGSGETTLTTGQWYVLKNKVSSNYFIDDAANSYSTTTAPKGFGTRNAKYLVRLESAGDGNYYVQTGFGNYLFGDAANTTTAVSATAYTESELEGKWQFHKLVNPLQPTADQIYTIEADGKTATEQRWVFVPTGFDNQYFLYNIAKKKFSYPVESGAWMFSEKAVPVLLESQGDSHYCITTKNAAETFKIDSEEHMTITREMTTGVSPVPTTLTSDESTNLNAALNNLLSYGVSKLTAASGISDGVESNHTDGWYALRIYSDSNHPEYAGNFLYTLDVENQAYGRPHPMSQGLDYMKHPTKDDATYYVRLWPVNRGTQENPDIYYHWQVPSGKYVVNHGNDYPITWIRPASDFIIDQNSDGTFYIQSSGYRAQICTDGEGNDYLGKTKSKYMTSPTRLDIYPVDVAAAGLTPWKVVFNTGADEVKLHCKRTDVHGLKDVYNHGYFFLPEGVTPVGETLQNTEFQIDGQNVIADVRPADYTIHVTYAPNVCFTSDDVTVVQGSRTTGVGNTMQALLRAEVSPIAPCYPKELTITLTGSANLTKVEAYLTTADQLYADGVTAVKLGEQTTLNDDVSISIPIPYPEEFADWTDDHLLMTGEHNYIWITADISSDGSVEANEVDAALTRIDYVNAAEGTNYTTGFNGNPDGKMRIFMRQKNLWVSTDQNSDAAHFYRNPAILSLGDGKVLAFCEYRYDDNSELGGDYDDSGYGHRIDIVMRKYAYDSDGDKWTWTSPVTIAAGTDATESVKASGYSKPAVVKTKTGKIICLMAMGSEAYDSNVGLRHIAMMTSSDEGDTWTTPTDIYNSIDWGTHSPSSAYITAGKGVCMSNGRVALVLNERNEAKSETKTDEYVIYSDDEGAHWTFAPSEPLFGNGKEAKLEVMNDNRLVATVSRGLDANQENRGYNFTTGSALANGIGTWETNSNWSTLNSYGRNNDILYYGRGTTGFSTTDVLLHTVYNNVSSSEALRLYASFDQAQTWNEFFTILPANAGVSSMQRLSDGNLAIIFEDGSIGGGANGSYALNYVVIKNSQISDQADDVMSSYIIKTGETNSSAPYVNWAIDGWTKSFTTKATTGFADIEVISSYDYAFNREGDGQRVLCLRASESGATDEITITAPNGYIIKSYTMTGYNKSTETYTLSADGVTSVVLDGGKSSPATFTVNNINQQTTSFSFKNSNVTNNSYALITNFKVTLARAYYVVKLNQVNTTGNGDHKSYATLYTDMDLVQTDNQTKAYYVTTVANDKAQLILTANEGRDIPKNTAVVLVNSEGNTQTAFNVTTDLSPVEGTNLLKGTLTGMELDMASNSNLYSFGRRHVRADESSAWGDYVAGFYNTGKSITLGANRAYLDTSVSPALERGFDLSWDNVDPASIEQHSTLNSQHSTPWYTLDGRVLSGMPTTKGIYIKNGKKVVIK